MRIPTRPTRLGLGLLLALLARPSPAAADGDLFGEALKGIARGIAGQDGRVRGPSLFLDLGYHSGPAFAVQLGLGWAWGRHNTGLFEPVAFHRVAVAPRVAIGRDIGAAASLTYGYSSYHIVGVGVRGGMDLRWTDGVAVGPVVAALFRYGPVGLFARTWAYLDSDGADFNLMAGLSFDLHVPRQPPRHRRDDVPGA